MRDESNVPSLDPRLNRLPDSVRHVHLMGICGTGMASLAGLLKSRGLNVTGDDQNVYPPMSDYLRDLGITPMEGYRPENLQPPPDLVVVGNVIPRDNPEVPGLAQAGIPYLSLPQALGHYALTGKRPIVISGTHGKTTTTALAAWTLFAAGLDPGYLIGGIPRNFDHSFRVGNGAHFVIEGDEYDTAFFDKGPKFLHYNPWAVVLTSIEFDHADIYTDLDHVLKSFRALIALIPPQGLLIANIDDPRVAEESRRAPCRVVPYGDAAPNGWRILDVAPLSTTMRVRLRGPAPDSETELEVPFYGRHNFSNLLAVAALAHHLGIPPSALSRAAAGFKGVKRRQEILGEQRGILVIDDFAHHPTAVLATLNGVRERYPKRRLLAVFEPRSNSSRRNVFQNAYAAAFDAADRVFIPEPPRMEKVPKQERFSSARLVEDLQARGLKAAYYSKTDALYQALLARSRPGDVVMFMSNGGFDGLPRQFLEGVGKWGSRE